MHEGRQIIAPATVDLMVTDRLTPEQRAGAQPFLTEHQGWGLGLATPASGAPSTGDPLADLQTGYGWDGGTGTTWRTDPRSGRAGILLTQRAMTSPVPPPLFAEFWSCVAEL